MTEALQQEDNDESMNVLKYLCEVHVKCRIADFLFQNSAERFAPTCTSYFMCSLKELTLVYPIGVSVMV